MPPAEHGGSRRLEPERPIGFGLSGEIETAISESKTALAGTDPEAMNNAFERLQTASHKLAEVLYSQAGAAPEGEPAGEQASSASASGDGSTTSSDEGDVIDAEYVDVEDEDKK